MTDSVANAIRDLTKLLLWKYDESIAILKENLEIVKAAHVRQAVERVDLVEEDDHGTTYHVGGLLCDEGQSPGGVVAITATRRPSLEAVAIVVGSPPRTPLPGAPSRLPKINGWAMSLATAKKFVATVQQAIRDVEAAATPDSP